MKSVKIDAENMYNFLTYENFLVIDKIDSDANHNVIIMRFILLQVSYNYLITAT